MKKLFEKKYSGLIFSLLSGVAYFILATVAVIGSMGNKGLLLCFFFFPAIICGVALVLLKSIKMWLEAEDYKKVGLIFWVHIAIMAFAILAAILMIMGAL